jgi:hypothetical protein
VYIGPTSGVTAANGFRIAAGESFSDTESTSAWYAITASGTGDLRVLQTGA